MPAKTFLRFVDGNKAVVAGIQRSLGLANKGDIPALSDSGYLDTTLLPRLSGSGILWGRYTSGAGAVQEIMLGSGLTLTGNVLSAAGSSDSSYQTYTADIDFTAGLTTSLTLSSDPGLAANLIVVFDGLIQHHATYSVTGTTLNFTSPIPTGTLSVEVIKLGGGGGGGGGGTWGSITGTLSNQTDLQNALNAKADFPVASSDTTYTNAGYPSLASVKDALDQLLYVAPSITSFTNTVGTVEIGSTVNNVTLNWTRNKTVTTQSLSPSPGSISNTVLTYAYTGLGLTTDRTYTLTIGDGTNTATASTTIAFRNKRFWGVTTDRPATASTIAALAGSELASSRNQSRSMTASSQYLCFAWPSTFGTPSFTVNGLPVTGWISVTVSYTNSQGYTSNYDIWTSEYLQSGTSIAVTVS